jgi:hypothetical protein
MPMTPRETSSRGGQAMLMPSGEHERGLPLGERGPC